MKKKTLKVTDHWTQCSSITNFHLSSSIPWFGSPSPNTNEKTYIQVIHQVQFVSKPINIRHNSVFLTYRFYEVHPIIFFLYSSPPIVIWIPVPIMNIYVRSTNCVVTSSFFHISRYQHQLHKSNSLSVHNEDCCNTTGE